MKSPDKAPTYRADKAATLQKRQKHKHQTICLESETGILKEQSETSRVFEDFIMPGAYSFLDCHCCWTAQLNLAVYKLENYYQSQRFLPLVRCTPVPLLLAI